MVESTYFFHLDAKGLEVGKLRSKMRRIRIDQDLSDDDDDGSETINQSVKNTVKKH
jgi:hypothetical protein